MHRFGRWTLILAVLVLWGTPARPAEEKMVPGEGAIELMLLRQKSVQDELKLTTDETDKIHAFTTQQYRKAEAIHKGNADEHEQKYRELARENERFIAGVLEPGQNKRLRQIMLQRAGLLMLADPKVAAELNLTADQKEKARELQKEAHKELVELHHNTDRDARHAKMQELHMSGGKRLRDLLTDQQEAKFKEMSGPPFDGKFEYHAGPEPQ